MKTYKCYDKEDQCTDIGFEVGGLDFGMRYSLKKPRQLSYSIIHPKDEGIIFFILDFIPRPNLRFYFVDNEFHVKTYI